MWLDNKGQGLVDEFWQRYGELEPFPRSLEGPLAFALPIALVKLPGLQLHEIETWLQRRSVHFSFNCRSRAVRGCLVAFRGQGVIFLDGTDPEDEKRFTLAHEIAHFMVDYWRPRQNAIYRFGDEVAAVVDGLRPPTITERIYALLGSMPIGVHTALIERDQRPDDLSGTLWSIEDRADRIALTLLAPPTVVLKDADLTAGAYDQRDAALAELLREKYGLPASIAELYSQALLNANRRGRSWLESVGLR